jgi:hypothetical protein
MSVLRGMGCEKRILKEEPQKVKVIRKTFREKGAYRFFLPEMVKRGARIAQSV